MKKLLALLLLLPSLAWAGQTYNPSAGGSGSGTVSTGTAGQAAYYTGATTTGSTPYITIGTAAAPVTLTGPVNIGPSAITDTGVLLQATSSVAGYNQLIIQNTNSGATASSNYVVNNNLGTSSTYYGEFGMNSSGFTGTGSFNKASAVYLDSQSGDLVLGTLTSNPIHFVVNNGATDAMTIATSGALSLSIPLGVSSGGTGSASISANLATPGNRPPLVTDDAAHAGYAINNIWNYNNKEWVNIGTSSNAANWQPQVAQSEPVMQLVSGALAGYAVYRLNSTYSGYAFRVQLTGGSYLDIPFDVNGIANWAMVDNFCGLTAGTCGISIWYDQSGNGYNLTQATFANMPSIDGGTVGNKRSISFDGTAANGTGAPYLANTSVPITNVQNFTAFFIGRNATEGASAGTALFNLGEPTYKLVTWIESQQNGVKTYDTSGHAFNVAFKASDTVTVFNDNAGVYTMKQDNLPPVSYSTVVSSAATGINLGNERVQSNYAKYDLLAFFLYNSSLSAANQQTLQLASYRDSGINPQPQGILVLQGDSMTSGWGQGAINGTIYPQMVTREFANKYNTFIFGLPAELLATMDGQISTIASLIPQPTGATKVAFVLGGTNDLAANDTAANVLGYYSTACANWHAAGFSCVPSTTPPRNAYFSGGQTSGGFETARQTLATSLRAAAFWDGLADIAADPIIGTQTEGQNTAIYYDGVHPNAPYTTSFFSADVRAGLATLLP